jgi:hypothetical protein
MLDAERERLDGRRIGVLEERIELERALVTNAKSMATVIVQYALSTNDPTYGIPDRG